MSERGAAMKLWISHVLIAVLVLIPFAFCLPVSSQSVLPAQPAAARTAPSPAEPAAPTAFSCDGVTEIPKTECEALVALYNGTNGTGWTDRSGWLITNTPCSWSGITCGQGHVTGLVLMHNNLQGGIPWQLGSLTSLQHSSSWKPTDRNHPGRTRQPGQPAEPPPWREPVNRRYPRRLGNLTKLQDLYLFGNRFTGVIPIQLTNLTNLRGLHLGGEPVDRCHPPGTG